MSHFTKLDRAQIGNVEAFVAACADLGFDKVTHDAPIKDYYGKKLTATVAVNTGKYDLALVPSEKNEGKYDMVADWWGVRGELGQRADKFKIRTDGDLQDYLLRHTTKHTIVNKYRRDGFRATVTEDANQNMTVKLTRAE